jgi:hypothetical protein
MKSLLTLCVFALVTCFSYIAESQAWSVKYCTPDNWLKPWDVSPCLGTSTCLGGGGSAYGDAKSCVDTAKGSNFFDPKVTIHTRFCALNVCGYDKVTLSGFGQCGWAMARRFCARATAPCAQSVCGDGSLPYCQGIANESMTCNGTALTCDNGETPYCANGVAQCYNSGPACITTKNNVATQVGTPTCNLLCNTKCPGGMSQQCQDGSTPSCNKCYGNKSRDQIQICGYEDPCDGMDKSACGFSGKGFNPYQFMEPNPGHSVTDNLGAVGSAGIILTVATGGAAAPVGALAVGATLLTNLVESKMNQVVIGDLPGDTYDSTLGCVPIPAAPPPPPFCSPLTLFKPLPVTEEICEFQENSEAADVCVRTSADRNQFQAVSNTFEKPLIRLGFQKHIARCPADITGNNIPCFTIDNETVAIHNTYNDMLPKCPVSDSTAPCITFYNYTPKSTGTLYRVVYGTAESNSSWYQAPACPVIDPACINPQLPANSCVSVLPSIYAVNDANFFDLGYYFATKNSDGIKSPTAQALMDPVASMDPKATSRSFYAQINPDDPMSICAYESTDPTMALGCAKRPDFKPDSLVVGPCQASGDSSAINKVPCTSTHTKPKMAIGLSGQFSDLGSGVTCISPLTSLSKCDMSVQSKIFTNDLPASVRLHGVEFSTIITDDNYTTLDGNNDGTIVSSNYSTDSQTFPNDPCLGNKCGYLGGLEYYKNVYVRGATKICIQSPPTNTLVLAKLITQSAGSGSVKVISNAKNDRIYPSSTALNPLSSVYTAGTLICYSGRVLPECSTPTTGCCNNCSGSCTGCKSNLAEQINTDTEGVRQANAMELGLCVDVPPPTACPVITSPGANDGNATWLETQAGRSRSGVCVQGKTGNPTRKCYPNGDVGVWGYVQNPCK